VTGREQAYAFYGVVFGIGFIRGPVLGGLLVHFGFAVPFLVAAGLEALNLLFTRGFLPEAERKGQCDRPTGVRVGHGDVLLRGLRALPRPRVARQVVGDQTGCPRAAGRHPSIVTIRGPLRRHEAVARSANAVVRAVNS
jgi:MFS family permease